MKKSFIGIMILAGLVTGACGSSSESAEPVSETSVTDTPPAAETGEGEQELTWFIDDFEGASAESQATGKPLLIDMYADWCGPCRVLGEQYFTSNEMYPVLSRFVLLRVDVENPDMKSLASRYQVSAIPCVVIAEADGSEIDRIVGTTPTVAQYIAKLEGILDRIR